MLKCKYLHIYRKTFCRIFFLPHLCRMEILTHLEAWDIFYKELRASEQWATLSDKDKNALITAERDRHGKRMEAGKVLNLGYDRAKRLIDTYAAGRFEWVEGAILKGM